MSELVGAQRVFVSNLRTEIAAALLRLEQLNKKCMDERKKIEDQFEEKCRAIRSNHDELEKQFLNKTIHKMDSLDGAKTRFRTLQPDLVDITSIDNDKVSTNRGLLHELMERKLAAEQSFFRYFKRRSIRRVSTQINDCVTDSMAIIDRLLDTEQAQARELLFDLDASLDAVVAELTAEKDSELASLTSSFAIQIDYELEQFKCLIANAKTVSHRLLCECEIDDAGYGFPGFVMIGQWTETVNTCIGDSFGETFRIVHPAILPLLPFTPLLIEYRNGFQDVAGNVARLIAYHLFRSVEAGSVRLAATDPTGLGLNISMFLPASTTGAKLVFAPTATNDIEICDLIDRVTKHIQKITETILKDDTSSFFDLARGGLCTDHSYLVLLIFGFPHEFTETSLKRLRAVLRNGPRSGVLPIIVAETGGFGSMRVPITEFQALSYRLVIQEDGTPIFPFDDFANCTFQYREFPASPEISALIASVSCTASELSSRSPSFSSFIPESGDWFTATSSDGVSVPIGCSYLDDKIRSELVFDDQHMHCLIAGAIGSGKSNLLQVLICGLLLRYSPQEIELYLVDMKPGGVEFSSYAKGKIPHARAVAVSHEPEFAIGVLKGLHSEMLRRNEQLFVASGVSNIRDYIRKTGRKLPRIVLVFDEFQNLFSNAEGDSLRQMQIDETKAHFNEIIRTSRSAGIHVLLASQHFDRRHLDEQIRLNIKTRIALRASSRSESEDILGERNFAAVDLPAALRGAAIVNQTLGSIEGNLQIVIPRIESEQIDTVVEAVLDAGPAPDKQFIFQSHEAKTLDQCPEVNHLLASPVLLEGNLSGIAYVGECIGIAPPVQIAFRKQMASNMLILGNDAEIAMSVIGNMAIQLQREYVVVDGEAQAPSIIMLDPTTMVSEYCIEYSHTSPTSSLTLCAESQKYAFLIETVYNDYKKRISIPHRICRPLFLFLFAIHSMDFSVHLPNVSDSGQDQRWRDEVPSNPIDQALSDCPGFFDELGKVKTPGTVGMQTLGQVIREITEQGPRLGIYTVCWADNLFAINNSFSGLRLNLDVFDTRVAMQMSEDDSNLFVRSKAAARLAQHRGGEGLLRSGACRLLLHCPSRNTTVKFRPFDLARKRETSKGDLQVEY